MCEQKHCMLAGKVLVELLRCMQVGEVILDLPQNALKQMKGHGSSKANFKITSQPISPLPAVSTWCQPELIFV